MTGAAAASMERVTASLPSDAVAVSDEVPGNQLGFLVRPAWAQRCVMPRTDSRHRREHRQLASRSWDEDALAREQRVGVGGGDAVCAAVADAYVLQGPDRALAFGD